MQLALLHQGRILEELGTDAHQHNLLAGSLRCLLLGDADVAHGGPQHVVVQGGGQEVHGRGADEPGHKQVDGLFVEFPRGGHLLQDALLQHRHPVAQGHGLGLVVGDIDTGSAQAALHLRDFGAHLAAELGVQVGKRLIEEERIGLPHNGPSHGHPLALPAREVGRLAFQVVGQFQGGRGVGHQFADLLVGVLALAQPQREGDVFVNRQVRVQRVILEHHRQVAVAGRLVIDAFPVDQQVAGGDVLQAHDHAQQRGLAAARGAHQDDELAVGNVQADVIDGREPVAVLLDEVVEGDRCHG